MGVGEICDFLYGISVTMIPLLLAAIGGFFSKRAGVLNIGLEGLLLMGAFTCAFFAQLFGFTPLGLLAAVGASTLLAALLALFVLFYHANLFVVGLAINFLSQGLATMLASLFSSVEGRKALTIFASLQDQRFQQLLIVVGWAIFPLAFYLLHKTVWGLRLRATGSAPEALRLLGHSPRFYQLGALLFSGVTCGLGGALLAVSAGGYVPFITSGRGWIALAIVYLGGKRMAGLLSTSLFFALFVEGSHRLQGVLSLPEELIVGLPYAGILLMIPIHACIASRFRQRREGLTRG